MPIAGGEFERELVGLVESPVTGGAADEESALAGAEHRTRGWRIAAAL